MIRDRIIKKAGERITAHIRARYSLVKVTPKQGLFNHNCHNNSVEFCRNNEGFGIVEAVCIEEGVPILHYLNDKDGVYYETTLGWRAVKLEYYVIRAIHESDYDFITNEFNRSQDSWLADFGKWYFKLFNIDRLL
ncbi:MAG: hypothetical protein ABUJ92_00575 [Desulfobacterales bacterium]